MNYKQSVTITEAQLKSLDEDNVVMLVFTDEAAEVFEIDEEDKTFITDNVDNIWSHMDHVAPQFVLWEGGAEIKKALKMKDGHANKYTNDQYTMVELKKGEILMYFIEQEDPTLLFMILRPRLIRDTVKAPKTIQ